MEDGEECKLVFNFTKGGFWLSQSIFPPTPAHHNYHPEARGRTHRERERETEEGGEGGRERLETAAIIATERPRLMHCFSTS